MNTCQQKTALFSVVICTIFMAHVEPVKKGANPSDAKHEARQRDANKTNAIAIARQTVGTTRPL